MGTHSLKEPCGLDAFTIAMQTEEKMFDRDPVMLIQGSYMQKM